MSANTGIVAAPVIVDEQLPAANSVSNHEILTTPASESIPEAPSKPINLAILDATIKELKQKVADAAKDGHFSQEEIVALILATIRAVQRLFPYLSGLDKKKTVKIIVHLVIKQLVSDGTLSPVLSATVDMLP